MKSADTMAIAGMAAAIFAFFGGIVLARTMAWDASSTSAKYFVLSLLIVSPVAIGACFRFLATSSLAAGLLAVTCLITISAPPFVAAFYYLFLGPSYSGLVGGVGTAIALAQLSIAGLAMGAGTSLALMLLKNRPNQAPEPTTTSITSRAPSSTSRAGRGRGSS